LPTTSPLQSFLENIASRPKQFEPKQTGEEG
jgi:hypothetical protein